MKCTMQILDACGAELHSFAKARYTWTTVHLFWRKSAGTHQQGCQRPGTQKTRISPLVFT